MLPLCGTAGQPTPRLSTLTLGRPRGRRGAISAWFLLAFPFFLLVVFLGFNVQRANQARATNQQIGDASALAAGYIMVDDLMLDGTPPNIATLELMAKIQAQLYANFNPPGPLPLTYADEDIS